MGGKSSKESGLKRTLSFRRSQKTSFQRIQKKLENVTKDIDSFSGTSQDEKYHKIKKNLTEIIDSLDDISSTVKEKHKDTYQDILDKCFDELNKLDSKLDSAAGRNEDNPAVGTSAQAPQTPSATASPLSSPMSERSTQSVRLNFVTISGGEDSAKASGKKESKKEMKNKRKQQLIKEDTPSISSQEMPTKENLVDETMETIHQIRKQIEYLEGEIYTYKQERDEALYGFIKETLTQILVKVDNLETHGNVQIKHERKLALQRAQECLNLLHENTPRASKTHRLTTVIPKNVLSEMMNSSKFKNLEKQNAPASRGDADVVDVVDSSPVSERSKLTKQVTFEINVNDEVRDELYKILHDRLEEASSEPENEKESSNKKPEKSNGGSTTKKPEAFENTDSEDDYDFVNVETDGDDSSKQAPVLITSF